MNWSGESDTEYPFHNCLHQLLTKISSGTIVVDIEFNCGQMDKVNLTVEYKIESTLDLILGAFFLPKSIPLQIIPP